MSFFTNYFWQAATFVENIGRSLTNVDFFLLLFCQAWMQAPLPVNSVNNFRKSGIWPLSMTVMIVFAPRPWFVTVKNHPRSFHKAQHNPTATPDLTIVPSCEHYIEHVSKPYLPPIWFRMLGDGAGFILHHMHFLEISCRTNLQTRKSRTTPQLSTVKPGYNDSGLRNTSSMTSDFCGTD
jgi:hypothetical protein